MCQGEKSLDPLLMGRLIRSIHQTTGMLWKFGAAARVDPRTVPPRTVIVATNAAETAVMFNQCWLCIDTCMVNQTMYDASSRAKVQQTVPLLSDSITAERRKGW